MKRIQFGTRAWHRLAARMRTEHQRAAGKAQHPSCMKTNSPGLKFSRWCGPGTFIAATVHQNMRALRKRRLLCVLLWSITRCMLSLNSSRISFTSGRSNCCQQFTARRSKKSITGGLPWTVPASASASPHTSQCNWFIWSSLSQSSPSCTLALVRCCHHNIKQLAWTQRIEPWQAHGWINSPSSTPAKQIRHWRSVMATLVPLGWRCHYEPLLLGRGDSCDGANWRQLIWGESS